MTNFNKYWIIMESLQFPMIGAPKNCQLGEEERLKHNMKVLRDNIKVCPKVIVHSIIEDLSLHHMENNEVNIGEVTDEYFLYCLYSLRMLLDICKITDFSSDAKEDLVSERHKSLIISSIVDVAKYALQENLHKTFYKEKSGLFKMREKKKKNNNLQFLVEAFTPLVFIKAFYVGKSLDDVHLCYMASIFSLLIAFDLKEYDLEQLDIENLQAKLQKMWLELSKKLYYRNLMLLFSSLPNMQKQRIHKEMLLRLWSPGGFVALLFAMAESQRSEDQSLDETVANLVSQSSFSIKAQHSLIKQILQFLKVSLNNKDYSALMGVGVLSLKKLYDNKNENKDFIKNWLQTKMEPLIKVDDISKAIAMEWEQFVELISLIFHIFCTSSIATLPSELLAPYLLVILELNCQIECHANQQTLIVHLNNLILRILNNRSKEELKQIIECLSFRRNPPEWYQLSPYIQIKENPLNMQELKLSLVDNNALLLLGGYKHSLASLVTILKNSSYTLLINQHFLILLQMVPALIMDTNDGTNEITNVDLLETKEDICTKIFKDFSMNYGNKIQIIKALEVLVQHQPIKILMNDNIIDLLRVLVDILAAFNNFLSKGSKEAGTNNTVLVIILILSREIIENFPYNIDDLTANLLQSLKQLEAHIQNGTLKYHLNCLLKTITGEKSVSCQQNGTSKNDFEEARFLIESNESYLQVQGIEMMIKLLNTRNEYAVTNCHLLTALAFNTLKSPESYTFLNCVRLFVAMVNVNESEILELLKDEYLSDSAGMDYRLVIGEAILKTSSEIGPLCYKYKNILLNTFMAGCRSPIDEFRFSAFSNLSQMCRQLIYQVHHYFQELINLIDCELTTGKYLPAKRAAVMVLSELLAGMDNLFDYEDMLLPIYRLLKFLAASEQNDEKMRIHASNGLKCLSEKCKELFRTGLDQQKQGSTLKKEIKIMGIHDKPKRNLKDHILEMN